MTESNMDIINEEFSDFLAYDNSQDMDICKTDDNIKIIGKAELMLSSLDNNQYFEFMKIFSKRFKQLNQTQKTQLKDIMCIKDKIIEKKIIVNNNNNNKSKKQKPKLNQMDDY